MGRAQTQGPSFHKLGVHLLANQHTQKVKKTGPRGPSSNNIDSACLLAFGSFPCQGLEKDWSFPPSLILFYPYSEPEVVFVCVRRRGVTWVGGRVGRGTPWGGMLGWTDAGNRSKGGNGARLTTLFYSPPLRLRPRRRKMYRSASTKPPAPPHNNDPLFPPFPPPPHNPPPAFMDDINR